MVNLLRKALAKSPSRKPTVAEIEQVFAKTQEKRQARTTTLKEHSHEQQRTELLDTPLHHLIAFYLLPNTDVEDVTFNFSRNMPLAEKLDNPKISPTPRLVPYKDELLADPKPRGNLKWIFIGFYLFIAWLVRYGMWVRSGEYGMGDQLTSILSTGEFPWDPTFQLKRTYFGIKPIDDYLVFLAAIYMPGLNNWNESLRMIKMYFLGMLIQPIAVWTVEAYRKRNMMTPVSL